MSGSDAAIRSRVRAVSFWFATLLQVGGAPHTLRAQDRLEPIADLEIKAVDLDDNLRFVLVSRDGLMLAHDAASKFLLFSRDGSLLRTFGGRGAGPGEFQSVVHGGLSGTDWW